LDYAQSGDKGLERFREIYKELVETNTTLSAGDCTLAAKRMAARLKAAGYPDQDLRVFVPDGHPKEGGLLAVLHGSDPAAKAILMLGHVDVVEAKREDWTRDPFILIEENGYFYARGTNDMKAQAAIWVDNMIRFREEGFKPKRSIKLALTCGEETNSALNGAGWLATNERQAIDAEFALTEGAASELDAQGRRVALEILAAEKTSQNFRAGDVTNPGGHSSRPVPDNAIYHVVRAVDRSAATSFPFNWTTRIAPISPACRRSSAARLAWRWRPLSRIRMTPPRSRCWTKDRNWHAMLRTTCVATMLSAGHATNALPQRATREHQLPHLSRRVARGCPGPTGQDRRRSSREGQHSRGPGTCRGPNSVDAANPEADRESWRMRCGPASPWSPSLSPARRTPSL
jgi:acetylornithine deacetylase/succinyl-diaminopimelate desuccinylase-like protein